MKCEVAHECKKITLGTAKEIRTEGREDSPWRTVKGTGRLSASELIIFVHAVKQRGVISLKAGTVLFLLCYHLHVTPNILLRSV